MRAIKNTFQSAVPPRSHHWLIVIAACGALVAICAVLQWGSGAYRADLGGHSDEPAHAVSGLMVYDYIAHLLHPGNSKLPLSPRAFAEAYYVHYPKAAIGRWPPLFYVLQAIALFVLGRTKIALLVLMLTTMAATAALLFHVMEPIAGKMAAFVMAGALLLFPVMQQSLYAVMPDALLALAFTGAAVVGGRGLEGSSRGWIGYGVMVLAAMLVHGRGATLLVAPWIAIVLVGKRDLLKSRTLWAASAVGMLLILVWVHYVAQTNPLEIGGMAKAAAAFPVHAFACLGPVFFCLTVLGAVTVRYRSERRWAFFGAMLPANWIFFSVALVPWDDRYLAPMLPACMVMACFGLRFLASAGTRAFRLRPGMALAMLSAGVVAASLLQGLPIARKPDVSYESLIRDILHGPDGVKRVYLIAGDPYHEGPFIVSLAMAETDAYHFAVRSSKAFAKSDWTLMGYELRFAEPAEVNAFLRESPISLLVVQEDSRRPDIEMLRAALQRSDWQPAGGSAGTLLFRRTSALPPGEIRVRVDMRGKLRKDLETTAPPLE